MNPNVSLKDILTPEILSLVNLYLVARTFSEVMRDNVNVIHCDILQEIPLYADLAKRSRRCGERIYQAKDMYLSSDDAACEQVYAVANKRERAAGLKPDSMPDQFCPALCAESNTRDVARLLVNAVGNIVGVTADQLLNAGIHTYDRFLSLIVEMVINSLEITQK